MVQKSKFLFYHPECDEERNCFAAIKHKIVIRFRRKELFQEEFLPLMKIIGPLNDFYEGITYENMYYYVYIFFLGFTRWHNFYVAFSFTQLFLLGSMYNFSNFA